MAAYHEVVFESEICAHLEAHGWLHSANVTGYDRERALFPEDLFTWLEETQKQAYEKALRAAGSKAKVLDVLTTALDKPLEHGGGTLNILRNGVQYIGGGLGFERSDNHATASAGDSPWLHTNNHQGGRWHEVSTASQLRLRGNECAREPGR